MLASSFVFPFLLVAKVPDFCYMFCNNPTEGTHTMKIGYARVSTMEQNLDSQIQQLEVAGCEIILEEKVSGAGKNRP